MATIGTAQTPLDDDITTISADQLNCPVCGASFHRVRRQRFCCDNCRKTAWARAHGPGRAQAQPVLPPGLRRANTLYICQSCETVYHGQQWCDDCARPCARIGSGGSCPHCDEPVAVADLIDIQIVKQTSKPTVKTKKLTEKISQENDQRKPVR